MTIQDAKKKYGKMLLTEAVLLYGENIVKKSIETGIPMEDLITNDPAEAVKRGGIMGA